jgi:hypothetical protein
MKFILILLALTFVFHKNLLGQKVTAKDLIGTWKILGEKELNVWRFDGKYMVESNSHGKASPKEYTIDNSQKITILHLFKNTSGIIIGEYFLIKLGKNNILKMQGGEERVPKEWNINENNNNTGKMQKIKG